MSFLLYCSRSNQTYYKSPTNQSRQQLLFSLLIKTKLRPTPVATHTIRAANTHSLQSECLPCYTTDKFFRNTTTNQQQTIEQKMFCYHYTVFSKTGERNLFTDQIVQSTPHIWAYTNATQPSLEPVFSHP